MYSKLQKFNMILMLEECQQNVDKKCSHLSVFCLHYKLLKLLIKKY